MSLAPRSLPEVPDTILAAKMRKPEFREAFLELARRKLAELRKDSSWRVDKRGIEAKHVGFDTRAADIRLAANFDSKRKSRLHSRQRELTDAGMAQLTPETLAAFDQGMTLEDQPLISSMLNNHGKLMSKTMAMRLGKLKTEGKGNAGDYDDAPRLPASWYGVDGGIMPDVMANNLGFDSVPAFWEALRSAIYSAKSANEGFKKARDAVRKVEADALAQASKETDQWAKDETAKVPTEKDRQVMALRTLDAILSAFPTDIRDEVGGFVKHASLGSDVAREKEIIRRLEKLDEVVEKAAKKHSKEEIERLFESWAKVVAKSGRVKSKHVSNASEQVDYAANIYAMSAEDQEKEIAWLERTIDQAGGAEAKQDAKNRLGIAWMFTDFSRRDSMFAELLSHWLSDAVSESHLTNKLKPPLISNEQSQADSEGTSNNRSFSELKLYVLVVGLALIFADQLWELGLLELIGIEGGVTKLLAVCGLWAACIWLWPKKWRIPTVR